MCPTITTQIPISNLLNIKLSMPTNPQSVYLQQPAKKTIRRGINMPELKCNSSILSEQAVPVRSHTFRKKNQISTESGN